MLQGSGRFAEVLELVCEVQQHLGDERVRAVMRVIEAQADRTGKKVMVAFNISDDVDAMRRHHDTVLAHGGTCVMASLNHVRDEYEFLEPDDRYRLLIDLGRQLEPMPPALKTDATKVRGCSASVWVYPIIDDTIEIEVHDKDIRIDTMRASGAGGQHVNKTDSAIRITHLPTGIVAECQDGRSQHSNKAKALQVLAARIQEKERSERAAKDAAMRKGLIGSGDRSDRIRTYNFPQGRLSDHRINLTLYKLQFIMEGELDEVVQALQHAREAEQLAELEVGGLTQA